MRAQARVIALRSRWHTPCCLVQTAMPRPKIGHRMHHLLGAAVAVWSLPALASSAQNGSCASIPAEALLALFALLFALRPLSGKR